MAWPLYALASAKYEAFLKAAEPASQLAAVRAMCELYVSRARPQWTVVDVRGPVETSASDMLLRLPMALTELLFVMWASTFPDAEPAPDAEV